MGEKISVMVLGQKSVNGRKMSVMALAARNGMRDSLESWPAPADGYSSWGIVIRDDENCVKCV